jgi:hypothetical protein
MTYPEFSGPFDSTFQFTATAAATLLLRLMALDNTHIGHDNAQYGNAEKIRID